MLLRIGENFEYESGGGFLWLSGTYLKIGRRDAYVFYCRGFNYSFDHFRDGDSYCIRFRDHEVVYSSGSRPSAA